jgi:hypothetical protein
MGSGGDSLELHAPTFRKTPYRYQLINVGTKSRAGSGEDSYSVRACCVRRLVLAPPDPALDVNDFEAAGFRNGQLTIITSDKARAKRDVRGAM